MGVVNIRFSESSSIGIKPISEEGSKRLIRSAIEYALEHQLKMVTLVHKEIFKSLQKAASASGVMNWRKKNLLQNLQRGLW